MRADFHFLGRIARDQLIGLDGVIERGRIFEDVHDAERGGHDVIGEGGELFGVVELERAAFAEIAVHDPDAELRQLVDLDFVAVVGAGIVEARDFGGEALDDAIAPVIAARRTIVDEIVITAAIFGLQNLSGLMEHFDALIEQG